MLSNDWFPIPSFSSFHHQLYLWDGIQADLSLLIASGNGCTCMTASGVPAPAPLALDPVQRAFTEKLVLPCFNRQVERTNQKIYESMQPLLQSTKWLYIFTSISWLRTKFSISDCIEIPSNSAKPNMPLHHWQINEDRVWLATRCPKCDLSFQMLSPWFVCAVTGLTST